MSTDEEIILPIDINSPGSLDEDAVFAFLKEPDEDAKYKMRLSSLYTLEPLITVRNGIISLFQKKPGEESLIALNSTVRSLLKKDVGEFIVPFYEERILKKGMFILKKEIKHDEGENLLIGLTDIWNNFYRELLPALQVIFYSVPSYKKQSIRERTLLSFRDEMLLKTQIRGSILLISRSKQTSAEHSGTLIDERVIAAVEQMFLVLLSVSTPSHRQYYELETLAAQVISPLMTARGVHYDGKVTPMAQDKRLNLKKARSSGNLKLQDVPDKTFTLPRMVTPKHIRQKSQPVGFLKELFNAGGSYTSDSKLYSRGRAQSQSDIL